MKTMWSLLKGTYAEWQAARASQLAAALAYYTAMSLAPFLILVIAILGLTFGTRAAQIEVVNQIRSLIGHDAAQLIETILEKTDRPSAASAAGLFSGVTLLFGALGVFMQLKYSLNLIWHTEEKKSAGVLGFIRERVLSFTMMLGIGFLLLVSLVVSAAIAAVGDWFLRLSPGLEGGGQLLNFALSLGIITVLFAMIFKFLPDTHIAWRDVWLGAAFTSLLFTVGKLAIGLYLGNRGVGTVYGAAGSLIVILLWVYYSAQILYFGAAFTHVHAREHGRHSAGAAVTPVSPPAG